MDGRSHKKPISIAVVGGGFGGVALTIGLLKRGVDVTLYESAPSFGEVGLGVIFGANVLKACTLIDPRLREGLTRCATVNLSSDHRKDFFDLLYGQDSRNANGKKIGDFISRTSFDTDSHGIPGEFARNGVHRAQFLSEMIRLVPEGKAQFSKTLTSIAPRSSSSNSSNDGVTLTFADSTTATADAVVGCDGIKSTVRTLIYPSNPVTPQYAGDYGYRALVPKDIAVAALGEERAHNGCIYIGYGGCIVTYPVASHKYINMFASHRAPWSDPTKFTLPGTKEHMLAEFEGFDETLVKLMANSENYDKWGIFDLLHEEKYYSGKVCIMGDAAHASSPYLGAGAGMAIEDAYILSNLLEDAERPEMLEDAFRAFDAVRRPRTQNVVRLSREAGLENSFLGPSGDDVEKNGWSFKNRYTWIFDFDLESHLEEARRIMRSTG